MKPRIKGWKALSRFTGLKIHRLLTAVGHYGFPKPVTRTQKQHSNPRTSQTCMWRESDVEAWMAKAKADPVLAARFELTGPIYRECFWTHNPMLDPVPPS